MRNKLLALALGLTLAVLLSEVLIRLVEPEADTKAIPMKNSRRVYGFAPHSQGFAGGIPFRTNSWGFRGPDFAGGPHTTVIAAIGDSYTFGYGVEYEDIFTSIVERRLQESTFGQNLRVVNLGIPGYNTSQELATLRDFGPRIRPRIVLLGYVLNDIQKRDASGAAQSSVQSNILRSLREHIHLLRLILPQAARLARAGGVDIKTTATREVSEYTQGTSLWQENQANLLELDDFCREINAELVVVVLPYFIQLNESHPAREGYDTVVRFLNSHGITAVSALDYCMGLTSREVWINPFDGHPNAVGHERLAAAALDALRRAGFFTLSDEGPPSRENPDDSTSRVGEFGVSGE